MWNQDEKNISNVGGLLLQSASKIFILLKKASLFNIYFCSIFEKQQEDVLTSHKNDEVTSHGFK